MRGRLTLAFLVSLVLIGGATWYRLTKKEVIDNSLVVAQEAAAKPYDYAAIVSDFNSPKSTSTPVTQKKDLTKTDLLGRGLITDYLSLASNGLDTDASVNALASKYVDSLPALSTSKTLTYKDIRVVNNDEPNLRNYAQAITGIYDTYNSSIISSQSAEDSMAIVATFNKAYKEAANELLDTPSPSALVSYHLKLINTYLASAAATRAILEGDKDAAKAFSGLIIFKQNLDTEELLLASISKILTSHGI